VAWLYGIARHVVGDQVRAARRVEPREQVPERPVDRDEAERLALAEAIAKLPKEQRQVIELKFLVGLANAEVGRALGRTPGAVNALQWRALRAMRERLSR
jgi:RNA polymerase sigma-70 factor (ECF subfamily)